MYEEIKKNDPQLYAAVRGEVLRQENNLELIRSEERRVGKEC